MSKQIKCPVCGNDSRIVELDDASRTICLVCLATWRESRRQQPEITPEMAWKWFKKKVKKAWPEIKEILLVDEDYYLTRDELIDELGEDPDDYEIPIEETLLVGRIKQNEHVDLINGQLAQHLGWKDMPGRLRDHDNV